MTPAFMFRLTRDDRIIYIFLLRRIVARVHITPNEYRDAHVTACGTQGEAQRNVVRTTEAWEITGFTLDAIYIHRNPNQSITGNLLTALARYREDSSGRATEEVLAEVAHAFYEYGERV